MWQCVESGKREKQTGKSEKRESLQLKPLNVVSPFDIKGRTLLMISLLTTFACFAKLHLATIFIYFLSSLLLLYLFVHFRNDKK